MQEGVDRRSRARRSPQAVVHRDERFVGSDVGEHLPAVDVAYGVHAGRSGLQVVVHDHVAARVDLRPHGLQADAGRVRLPADRHEDLLGGDLGAVRQLGRHVVVRVLGDALHLGLQQHLDAALAVRALELLGQPQVFQREHLRQHLYHGDPGAQLVVEGGELAADDPGPHDEERLGRGLQR